jgi:hypothetical protein
MPPALKRHALFIACSVGVLLMVFFLSQKPAALDDFRPFYRAARMPGSPDLFVQTQYHADGLMFLRTPFYAALLYPLGRLDYATARGVWATLMAICFALALWLWPGERSRMALAACWSVPVMMALALVQDIALMLLITAVALRLWQSQRRAAAGLVASLLALKVTLLLPVALVFLARSRRGFIGLLAGCAVQLAACFAIQGPGWIPRYLAAVRSPLLDHVPARMPCFAAFVTGPPFVLLAVATYVWIWWVARRKSPAAAITIALPLGIVAAPHCYAYDMAAAIPLLAAAAGIRSPRGVLALLALSPAPYLLMSLDHPGLGGAALLIGAVLLASAGRRETHRGVSPLSCPAPAGNTNFV